MEKPWLTTLEHFRRVRLWQGFRTFESFRYFDSNEVNLSAGTLPIGRQTRHLGKLYINEGIRSDDFKFRPR